MDDAFMLAIECEADASAEFASKLGSAAQAEVTTARRSNLDGSPATTLQIVQVAATVASSVASLVSAYVAARRVKKIKVGTVEIENPTREQWERLWADRASGKQ